MQKTYSNLIKGIRQYFEKNNLKKAVIGLSGGIDSSLSAFLVAKAIGPKNLLGLIMPEIGVSSKESTEYAKKLAELIGISYSIIPINSFLAPYKKSLKWKENKIAIINTKARTRANILYNYANTHNAIVIGTSNKSEMMLGYFTKYGDGACDLEVIGSLYKTEVYKLAKHLKLPKEIIERAPTAELFHGHTDEKELGAPYSEIDKILKQVEKGKKPKGKLAGEILKRIKENEHKTKAIPIIK
ncbi:NAD+ synthase [Candidatus Woesearchaeota archaeon]|nr:NAD+ synthase [Candidatus Woesearchaeota archaeon]